MYGLIGKKLGHSFSADFFNKKFKEENIDEVYRLFPLESVAFLPALIKDNPDLKGLNVTIPYKEDVISYLDEISPEAREIGAVNVMKILRHDSGIFLKGYNTDAIGFKYSLLPLLTPDIRKALVLGSGGASKAVRFVLNSLGIYVTGVSRTEKPGYITYDELNNDIIKDNLLIVNTTPLGMFPDTETCPPIPYQFLTTSHVCYDLVYNPEETLFLKKSKNAGAKIKNGLEMLWQQALAAWDIWANPI